MRLVRPSDERQHDIHARASRASEDLHNYEEAVTFISSFQEWLSHIWGPDGTRPTLTKFERFPRCEGLQPDFLASFTTGYRLCGEVMRTFRTGPGERKDIQQVVGYSQYLSRTRLGSCGDVVLFVHPYSDEFAAQAVGAAREGVDGPSPESAIVVIGYLRERLSNGEWYNMKWRDLSGNSRFTRPNTVPLEVKEDLNWYLTEQPRWVIRVDLAVFDASIRNPFINDEPPPLYTIIRVIMPRVVMLLTDEERDELQATGRVEKRVSRDALMAAEGMISDKPPEGYLKGALEFMVERGWARPVQGAKRPEYVLRVDAKIRADLAALLGERTARYELSRLVTRQRRAARRASRRQIKLPWDQ
jgi:hypothetical protein